MQVSVGILRESHCFAGEGDVGSIVGDSDKFSGLGEVKLEANVIEDVIGKGSRGYNKWYVPRKVSSRDSQVCIIRSEAASP